MLISGRIDDVLLGSTSISHKKSHIEDNSDIDIHYSHLNSFENDKPDMLQLIVDEQIKQFLWKIILHNKHGGLFSAISWSTSVTRTFMTIIRQLFSKIATFGILTNIRISPVIYLGLLYNKIRITYLPNKGEKNLFQNTKSKFRTNSKLISKINSYDLKNMSPELCRAKPELGKKNSWKQIT